MISALDTNVLLDILLADERFEELSLTAIERAAANGSVVICHVVYAELSAFFANQQDLDVFLEENSIEVHAIGRLALFRAGSAWKAYRQAGGSRTRILADFMIGAHAETECSALVSRDRGFYRDRFSSLAVIDPSLVGGQPH